MSAPKRHHFIPRFFLERFCRDGLLWVYDRDRDAYRQQAPLNTAVITHYYTITEEDGTKNTEVERAFAALEGETKPILEKLERREELSEVERGTLALFVALMNVRVPEFEHGMNELAGVIGKQLMRLSFADEERAQISLRNYERGTGRPLGATASEMSDFILREEAYSIEFEPHARLAMILQLAQEIAPLLFGLEWAVLHTPPKKAFVLSDNPFVLLAPRDLPMPAFYGVGILTPGALKFIPLGAHTGLLMRDAGHRMVHAELSDRDVRALNIDLTLRAESYVFARDKRLLRNLISTTKLSTRERLKKIQVG